MKWSAAEALSWISHGVATPLNGWDENTYSGVEQAQRKLRTALANGRVRGRGRAEQADPATGRIVAHGLLQDVPPDPFNLSDVKVVIGVHGDMVTLPAHKRAQYTGPCWRDLQFDAAEVKREWPRLPSAVAQEWMRKDAEELEAAGKIGKRDDMVSRCRQVTGCARDEAVAAYKHLPDKYRRARGAPGKAAKVSG